MSSTSAAKKTEALLRAHALSYPGTYEEFPWGERAIKVQKKVFLFMRATAKELGLSVKLPDSSEAALMFPFASPTGYGLGKSGWVSAKFDGRDEPPIDVLLEWIDESFRAVAPKRLVAGLAAGVPEGAKAKPKKARAKAKRKAPAAKGKRKKAPARRRS